MGMLRFVAEHGEKRFEIFESCGEGFYVFRYINGQNTHDFLQDDLPMAYLCAEEEWQILPSEWREAMPGELPLWQQK